MPRLWLFGLAFCLILQVGGADTGRPQGSAEVQQMHLRKQELQRMQRRLSQYRQSLRHNAMTEQSLLVSLERLSLHREDIVRDLRTMEQELQTTQKRAQELEQAYHHWVEQVQLQRHGLAQRLRQLYKLGRLPYVALLLSAKDVAAFAYKVQYIRYLVAYDRRQMQRYREGLTRVTAAQEALHAQRQRVLVSQTKLQQQEAILARGRQRKAQLLQRIRQEKHLTEQAVSELVQTSKELSRFIENLQQAIELTPPATVVKGQLLWPVNGPLLLAFGRVRHRHLDVYTWQKGVYIGAPMGSDVRVIGAGSVIYADWFKGFGRLLIVDHSDHVVSLYGHTSAILVVVGDTVQPHQVVAKVGDSNALGESALYFEMRYHTVPQDPLLWLRQRSARLTE